MKTTLKQIPKTQLKLNPKMKSFFVLLTMSSEMLENTIESELAENPYCECVKEVYVPTAFEFNDITANKPSLFNDFMEQLSYVKAPYSIEVAKILLQNLDSAGRLICSEKEIAHICRCSIKEVSNTRKILMNLEPKGICARTLEECLCTQAGSDKDLCTLIKHHLKDIAQRNITHIQETTHWDPNYISSLIQALKKLNPCPGYAFDTKHTQYLRPDLEILQEEDHLKVVPIRYFHIVQSSFEPSEQSQQYRKGATRLQDLIQAREETLLKVADLLVQKQSAHLLKQEPLQAISMTEIAGTCSLSISTISRTIKDKSVLFHGEVYLLSTLLCTKVNGISKDEIKNRIQTIQRENPNFSDQRIAEELNKEGIQIARRTVAKYRNART